MPRGLSSKIYLAFLLTAVVPTSIAGLVGIFYSFDVLKREMLLHLAQETTIRADAQTNFFKQLSSEISYLANAPAVRDLPGIEKSGERGDRAGARDRIKRAFAAFAQAYPYIYQIRYLDVAGREIVRVDRRDGGIYDVPESELQDKSDRYYVRDTLAVAPGEIYVSPLDLNVEGGQPEYPEKSVIRLGTPIIDGSGARGGLLIVNLHAEVILDQVQNMADARSGTAFLFNRSGFYLSRSADGPSGGGSRMKSVDDLGNFPRSLLSKILEGHQSAEMIGDWIIAYAPIVVRSSTAAEQGKPVEWAIMLAYPRDKLLAAVFSLTLLYGTLTTALAVTAASGFLLSRHLLRPLLSLRDETEEIAQGNFSSRVEIRGEDEIAELGQRFNAMAGRLEGYYAALEDQKQHLEAEVQARTAALKREQDERRELDRQLFQTEKMTTLGELAMGLAHEIGNPLAGMKAVVQALRSEELDPATTGRYLSRIEGEVDRLSSFLHTFHGFAAPQEMHPQACSLDEVLEDVLLWTRKEARSQGITIESRHCAPSVPLLWADQNQLKQVLLNLVINAGHAMPNGGRITIGMCGPAPSEGQDGHGPCVKFCIDDTGEGIPADVLPKIFDPFFTTRPSGSGLGLAVVKKIVEQHGAAIVVESAPGQGTRFTLIWPVAGDGAGADQSTELQCDRTFPHG